MDRNYTPAEARAALALQAVEPVIIPPMVSTSPFGGLTFTFGHKITTAIGTVTVADQEASPTKPADKAVSFSTYGVVIPISTGRRRLSGNVLESTPIKSRMVGTYDYYVTYQIPITVTTEPYGGLHPDNNLGDDTTQSELIRRTHTVRVFQNNDDTSPNWVDIEVIDDIQFKNPSSLIRDFHLNNPS